VIEVFLFRSVVCLSYEVITKNVLFIFPAVHLSYVTDFNTWYFFSNLLCTECDTVVFANSCIAKR